VLIPAILHIDPERFEQYAYARQVLIRDGLVRWIAGGQGMQH
jgi:hypothetical protein